MYADDTNITAYHTNINKVEDVLNKDLDILYRWLQANRLSLNVLQSEYMLIGSKVRINKLTSDPKIFIGGHRLKRVIVTKSLGLMIDENLSWEEHVNYISKKVAKGLGMFRRIRDLVPINTLVITYTLLSFSPILIIVVVCGIIAEKVYGINFKNYKIEQLQ